MDMPLECTVDSIAGEPLVVTVRGEIDLGTAPELEACVRRVLAGAPRSVILDLEGVTFLDSSGLRALVTLSNAAQLTQSAFALRNVPHHAQRVLELTGLTDMFEQVDGA